MIHRLSSLLRRFWERCHTSGHNSQKIFKNFNFHEKTNTLGHKSQKLFKKFNFLEKTCTLSHNSQILFKNFNFLEKNLHIFVFRILFVFLDQCAQPTKLPLRQASRYTVHQRRDALQQDLMFTFKTVPRDYSTTHIY